MKSNTTADAVESTFWTAAVINVRPGAGAMSISPSGRDVVLASYVLNLFITSYPL